MIIGHGIIQDPEDDPERYREEFYQYSLDKFEGVPYTLYGISDELSNLAELIQVIGVSVTEQEQDFRDIHTEELRKQDGTLWHSDRLIDNWYKKEYRQFSYKAIMIIAHSTFEKGLRDLNTLLEGEKRINKKPKSNQLIDLLKALKSLNEKAIEKFLPGAHAYNFIRNKLAHSNGLYKDSDTGVTEFLRFIKNRTDISVEISKSEEDFTHRLRILNSSLLKGYLIFIKEIFTVLVTASRSAQYQPSI